GAADAPGGPASRSDRGSARLVHASVDDAGLPFVEAGRVGGVREHILRAAVDLGAGGDGWHSAALGEQGGVSGQVQRPAFVVGDAVAYGLPAGAVPVEVTVLQLDPGAGRGLGDEPDLDLAGVVRVGLDLPLRADVPAEHHPVRWFVGQDPRPAALAAVDAA